MAQYMIQFTYQPETWASLIKMHRDRSASVAALTEKLGGRLNSFYYCLGEYDGQFIVEFPDDVGVATLAVVGKAVGHSAVTKVTKLLGIDDVKEALRRAEGTHFT